MSLLYERKKKCMKGTANDFLLRSAKRNIQKNNGQHKLESELALQAFKG